MNEAERRFLHDQRVGRLATANRDGNPHVVPVCFVLVREALYITIDQKRKRGKRLKRISNILENPSAAFVADRYDEDWTQLGWVMLRGRAEILEAGPEHTDAQALLRAKYAQYRAMALSTLPVIALRIERVTSWGKLTD